MATLVVRASSKLGSSYASSIMTVCSFGAETPKVSALFLPLPISFAFLIAKRREANGAAVAGVTARRRPKTKSAAVRRLFIAPNAVFTELEGIFESVFFKAFRRAADNGTA